MIARTVGIPVIVVVPEVNLADWETRQPVPWLPGDGVARWHRLCLDAADALARSDWQAAIAAAESMLALDGGTCPTTWRLAARAREGLGDQAGAAVAARAEIDAAMYPAMAFLGAPQAGPAVQQLLRDLARRLRATTVDLPTIFAAHTGSPFPGRRLFLDYCHLTAEGIAIATAAIAAAVFDASGMLAPPPAWPEILTRAPAPAVTPEAEATARLGAAVHSAHRLLATGPKASILEHWCASALAASPGIEATLCDLVGARGAHAPAVLTSALAHNAASPYRLLLQHGWRWDQLDADAIAAIRAVLPARAADIDELLLPLADLPTGGRELAAPPFFFLWEPLERFFPEVMPGGDLTPPAYLRCAWPTTSFALVAHGQRDIDLELTARLPSVPGAVDRNGSLELDLAGKTFAVIALRERWSRSRIRVARMPGAGRLARLTLRWPLPPPVGAAPLAAAVARLAQGLTADLHPVFGEVFSLRQLDAS